MTYEQKINKRGQGYYIKQKSPPKIGRDFLLLKDKIIFTFLA